MTAQPSLFDPALYMLAQFLDDVEGQRKAHANRLRILTTTEPDEDGVHRGFGLDDQSPVVQTVKAQLETLENLEHAAILDLQRAMRKHPLNTWRKGAKGVGEKQLARLLAAVGDPYLRGDNGQPRTVSQLWAYCGLHTLPGEDGNTAARRKKGAQANWSTTAKTRAYLIATSCLKQTESPYRAVYLERRERTAATRPDWTPGHSHADGLRVASKAILKDLWKAARDFYVDGGLHVGTNLC